MNPYDFVSIDWNKPPERRPPVWHHRLTSDGNQTLYSGYLDVDVFTEKPLFIVNPRAVSEDPRKPAQSMQNQRGEYIIPGSSLKGMLRSLVEALGNGCLTLFDGQYERGRVNYWGSVPESFQHCGSNKQLCIACRTFGMLKERTGGVFLGKVNVSDAYSYLERTYKHEPIYTAVLVEPKPRHDAFYLDAQKRYIAGRKFYFHHSPDAELRTARGPIFFGDRPANRFIQPLGYDTGFHFRLDFTNLESDEFGVLLLVIALEESMRHKIGYGKPLGLGSVQLTPTSLTLVDYRARYARPESTRGKKALEGESMWNVLYEHIDNFSQTSLSRMAMEDLQRIWLWPPDPDVDYSYPSRDWFDTAASRGRRIADTRNAP